jgi:hypothetical protein
VVKHGEAAQEIEVGSDMRHMHDDYS